MKTLLPERRKYPRVDAPSHLAINLLRPSGAVTPHSVNVSEGGLCLRLQDMLEVRSLVRLQLTQERAGVSKHQRPVECTGRVAWVIQRLDLRGSPPFLFDVGIEFTEVPPLLRQLMVRRSGTLTDAKGPANRARILDPAVVHGRCFVPRLEREVNHALHWHLIVWVDGTPCFSGHYASERDALTAWDKFRRQQAKKR